MSLLILSSADVDRVLTSLTTRELQDLMARVFYLISMPQGSASGIDTPHRTTIHMQNHTALFMPARVAHPLLSGTTMKAVCVPKSSNDTRGLPGSTIVMDEETGAVKALINARSLTAYRNAAGSLLSTNIVGIRPTSVVAFGAGKQIDAHLELHFRSFPSLTSCTIVNRTSNARATSLAERLRSRFPSVTITVLERATSLDEEKLQKAVSATSLIICATSATAPLFPADWVRAGAHVILVGSYTPAMREVERELVLRAVGTPSRLLVDSKKACAIEAGELIEAGLGPDDVLEIGECIEFEVGGETRLRSVSAINTQDGTPLQEEAITMFKSVGLGLQDVAIACAVVAQAKEVDIGTKVTAYDI